MVRSSHKDMTEGPIWKNLLGFFLPIAAGTCIQQLYNAVDGMIISKFVGTVALAAVGGSAAMIVNMIVGFFTAMTTGAAIVIAHLFGAGKKEELHQAAGNALVICAILGVGLTVFGIVASPMLLRLLKTPSDTMAGAILYLRIYFSGVIFILLLNMESNILRSRGDAVSPFLYMMVGCVTNIVLDFLFVYFFHWGIAGVAVATVIAQIVNMFLLSRKLLDPREEFHLKREDFTIQGDYLPNMTRLGLPAGLESGMFSISNMIIQVAINQLGTVVVASWSMSGKVDGIFWAVSNAFGTAVATFIGQNVGAGKIERVKKGTGEGTLMALGMTVVLSTALLSAGRFLLHILTDDPAVVETTLEIMWYFIPYYFTWSLIEVMMAVLRGAGDAVKPIIIVGLGICLFRVIWIMTIFRYFGTLQSLSLSYVASWAVTAVALYVRYRRGKWKSGSMA